MHVLLLYFVHYVSTARYDYDSSSTVLQTGLFFQNLRCDRSIFPLFPRLTLPCTVENLRIFLTQFAALPCCPGLLDVGVESCEVFLRAAALACLDCSARRKRARQRDRREHRRAGTAPRCNNLTLLSKDQLVAVGRVTRIQCREVAVNAEKQRSQIELRCRDEIQAFKQQLENASDDWIATSKLSEPTKRLLRQMRDMAHVGARGRRYPKSMVECCLELYYYEPRLYRYVPRRRSLLANF